LPGSFEDRLSTVLHNVRSCLAPKGVVFGSTILGTHANSKLSSMLLNMYNKNGVLNNRRDNVTLLERVLEYYFTDVDIQIVGNVAMFKGKMKPGKRDGYAQMVPYAFRRRDQASVMDMPLSKIGTAKRGRDTRKAGRRDMSSSRRTPVGMEGRYAF